MVCVFFFKKKAISKVLTAAILAVLEPPVLAAMPGHAADAAAAVLPPLGSDADLGEDIAAEYELTVLQLGYMLDAVPKTEGPPTSPLRAALVHVG